MKHSDRQWWFGYVTALCLHSLYQGLLGKDEYLRRAAFDWVAWYYTIPLAIALLIAAWVYAAGGEK